MPPSPSLRRSPSMEPRADSHKRGCSLESGLSFKEKDDDLALFNEMQSREEDNFLLRPTDDFEDVFSSKVKPFPDLRLGINIAAGGESSDLLNAEGDKNDYDWLLTPPDTPLFSSLDDEPVPINLIHNGRARSRPISFSRSSTMEKRSSRGSLSPQRLSPSPRSGSSNFKGRSSSAPQTTPVPLRPGTPSRRASPPPVKPSTTPPRTSSSPPRRDSASSSTSVVTSGLRGASPVRTSRGNSALPKIRAWQSNIPGFSLVAPPNLRTSLADRPASYIRGSSPASRASNSSSKVRRQSTSPTASRSISSSHSQDRDRLSSHSKGSVVSSGDYDAESLQSIPVNVTERPASRRGVSSISNSKPVAFSKKPTKTFSPTSAPKRSFDSAMRQMDRKSPQNMFRPLLSSVPSSTFYAGKASVAQRAMISRNSSVTTSSNASSDQATSGARDTEGSDQYQDDMASESARAPFSDIQDEVFAIDEIEVASEYVGRGACDNLSNTQLGEPDKGCLFASNTCDSEESRVHLLTMSTAAISEAMRNDFVETNSHEKTLLCSICGCWYRTDEVAESEQNICPECKHKGEHLIAQNISVPLMRSSEESMMSEPNLAAPQLQTQCILEAPLQEVDTLEAHDTAREPMQSCSDNSLAVAVGDETIRLAEDRRTIYNPSCASNSLAEVHKGSNMSDSNNDMTEGHGISVLLLKRSSSLKGPLIHGRTFNSSGVAYDDLFNTRELTSSVRSSVGHGSVSTSSSVDLASARQGEVLMQRQLSCRITDTCSRPQNSVSSFSGTSMQVGQGFGLSRSSHEESHEGSMSNMQHIVAEETLRLPSDKVLAVNIAESQNSVPSVSAVSVSEETSTEKDASVVASCTECKELDNSQDSIEINEGRVLCEIGDDVDKSVGGVHNVEESVFIESSLAEETKMPDDRVGEIEVADDPQCALRTSEIEIDDSHPSSPRSQIDLVSREDVEDASTRMHPDKDIEGSSLEPSQSDHADDIVEDSIVTVEDQKQGRRRPRSLTLEEATDTILFCSSIVHDLAYKAASIAIEKEKENLEPPRVSRPTITIPEKRSSERRDPRGATGRAKTQKTRKTRAETEPKSPPTKHDEKSDEPVVRNVGLLNNSDSMKPPKLESKCNCTIM